MANYTATDLSKTGLQTDSSYGNSGDVLRSQGQGLPPIWDAANVDFQEFTSSGTWTKPAGINFVYVEVLGGGGGGGNDVSTAATSGGSGGQFISALFSASTLSAAETVTVGLGGLGTPNGSTVTASNGGNSLFSSLLAYGGKGGRVTSNFTAPAGALSSTLSLYAIELSFENAAYGGTGANNGGRCQNGGGGGGGSTGGLGGVSQRAGNGGNGENTPNTKAGNGLYPAGGGGASISNGGGGDGADGRVRVWAW